jgi:hypothetical protein
VNKPNAIDRSHTKKLKSNISEPNHPNRFDELTPNRLAEKNMIGTTHIIAINHSCKRYFSAVRKYPIK